MVATGLFQFFDLVVQVLHIHAVQGIMLHGYHVRVTESPFHLDDRVGEVKKLLQVDSAVPAAEVAGNGPGLGIDGNGLVQQVDFLLSVSPQVDVAPARRALLLREQHVQHKRIFSVSVPACFPQIGVVLAGVEHGIAYELAVLQNFPPACHRVVIPVHHQRFARPARRVFGAVLGQGEVRLQVGVLQLGIALHQRFPVQRGHQEHIPALLNILDARLPEQVRQVDAGNRHVAQAVPFAAVPINGVYAGAMLVLFPRLAAVHFLKMILFQYHRQDAGQPAGLLLVALLPGQNDGFGVSVHHVGMLAHDHVHQPFGGAFRGVGIALLQHGIPGVALPPHFVGDEPGFQPGFPRLILFQGLRRFQDPVRGHAPFGRVLQKTHLFIFRHFLFLLN